MGDTIENNEGEGDAIGRRPRRSTKYSGDFHINFGEGSSDEDYDRKKKTSSSSAQKKRTKECPGCGANVNISLRECRLCDYQFTSKSMIMGQTTVQQESQSIRDKFPFEPERDDDGTLIIQSILGRRPRKTGKRWTKSSGSNVAVSDLTAMDAKYEYEYLIKFKNMSYMHVQWLSANDIEAMNQKSKNALSRYLTKLDKGDPNIPQDGEIDPSYLEVEKILDYREEEVEEIVDDLVGSTNFIKELELKVQSESAKEHEAETNGLSKTSSLNNIAGEDGVETRSTYAEAEIGKTPSQIFNPVERCRHVLEKIMDDPYAISFIDPVDVKEFDDYLDIVEEPISLSDIQQKLDNNEYSKYNQYKQFAQDVRKVWRNCKLYNVYKSPIWHSANYLSMLFERLFQAWVTSFSDGTLPLSNAIARPWESSCRVCLKDENDEQMMLCDHCDATYHTYCLKPPLAKIPEDAWMCPRCLKWLAQTGAKVMSATAEEEARALVDGATSKKVIRVKKKKYLVKWRGLSYRDCTWETVADINDDEKIAEYHKLNDSPPDEPPLTQAEIGVELAKDRKNILYPAGVNSNKENPITDLDGQIYAQIRGYHFLKWNKTVPHSLLNESGPSTFAYTHGSNLEFVVPKAVSDIVEKVKNMKRQSQTEETNTVDDATEDNNSLESKMLLDEDLKGESETKNQKNENGEDEDEAEEKRKSADKNHIRAFQPVDPVNTAVTQTLSEMLFAVARDHEKYPIPTYPTRPPLPSRFQAPSEIEVCVPKGTGGLCMRIGNFRENVIVLGFKPDQKGVKGPVERTGRVKAGDFLVAINGYYVYQLKFAKILKLLNAVDHPFLYLRFLRFPPCIEGKTMNLVMEYFNKKLSYHPVEANKSFRLPFLRSLYFGVFPAKDNRWVASYYDDDYQEEIIGEYENELEAAKAYDEAIRTLMKKEEEEKEDEMEVVDEEKKEKSEETEKKSEKKVAVPPKILNFDENGDLTAASQVLHRVVTAERAYSQSITFPVVKPETEKNRRFSYNSDDDFDDYKSIDSYDTTSDLSSDDERRPDGDDDDDEYKEEDEEEIEDEDDDELVDEDEDEEVDRKKSKSKPVEKESSSNSAPATTSKPTAYEPEGPVSRLLRAVNQSEYPPIKSDWVKYVLELATESAPLVSKIPNANRGKKVEQYDMVSNQLLRTWPSIIYASRGLNIPTNEIFAALTDSKDAAGGFKWKYSSETTNPSGENPGEEAEEDFEEEKKDNTWQLKLPTKSKEYKNGGTLRDYQVEGLNWLLRCWYMKRSSILADEMGLGKTVQVVTMLDHLFEVESIKGPFLICVPLSTIGHWRREIEGWSHMQCCLYHDIGGGRDMRDVIREFEWYYKGRSRRLLKFHVLITTYDDLTRDYEELAEIPWRVVVVDEAHRLRNINSKLLECMRTVATKGQVAYGYQHRILMTGTPLQNNTIELWSLLNFIEPAKFPDLEKFQQRFGRISTQEQVENLQRRIGPHLLRRVKEDVAKDIPPKEETIIDVELTTMQKQYYRAIFEHNHSFLVQNLKGNIPKLMNIQMELRKCCNHPFLINGIEQIEMETLESKIEETANHLSGNARSKLLFDQNEFERKRMEEVLIPSSGKMVLLDKLLPKLRKEGHKVLIFSQMVRMIDIIEEYCEFRAYPCARLDGRVSGNDRQKSIDNFNKDPNAFVFLLSTRAGGVGINLTAADMVIIFDSDWNPQNDIQAMARCHRIGQSKNVKIYRLITRRSFEADMFERASKKLGLEQAVLGTRNFNDIDWDETNPKNSSTSSGVPTSNINMDAKEMEKLLREGAYSLLIEDDGELMKEFFEQDIEQILVQRTHVLVETQPQQTESWLNKRKKTGRTSKRMFTGDSAKEHAEIDVNDPDFWKKVLPDLVTPDSMLERLNDSLIDDNQDDETNRENIEKFMKDLSQMMDGMLDLSRRNQLPEHERAVCLKLLIRVTLQEDVFDEDEILLAKEWLQMIEGTRSRRSRQDIYKVEDINRSKRKKKVQKIPGKRGRPKYVDPDEDDDLDLGGAGDDDIDEPIEEDDDDDEEDGRRKRRKKGTAAAPPAKGKAAGGSATPTPRRGRGPNKPKSTEPKEPKEKSTGKRGKKTKKGVDDEDEEALDDTEERFRPYTSGRAGKVYSDDEDAEDGEDGYPLKRKRSSRRSSGARGDDADRYVDEDAFPPLPKKRQRRTKAPAMVDDDEEGGGNGEYQDGDFDEEDFGVKRKKSKGNSGASTPASTRKKRTPKAKKNTEDDEDLDDYVPPNINEGAAGEDDDEKVIFDVVTPAKRGRRPKSEGKPPKPNNSTTKTPASSKKLRFDDSRNESYDSLQEDDQNSAMEVVEPPPPPLQDDDADSTTYL